MRLIPVAATCVYAALFALGCTTNTHVKIDNATGSVVSVQVNERAPVKIAAGQSVRVTLPALERLQPLSIIARDERGAIIYSASTTAAALDAGGDALKIIADDQRAYDPAIAY